MSEFLRRFLDELCERQLTAGILKREATHGDRCEKIVKSGCFTVKPVSQFFYKGDLCVDLFINQSTLCFFQILDRCDGFQCRIRIMEISVAHQLYKIRMKFIEIFLMSFDVFAANINCLLIMKILPEIKKNQVFYGNLTDPES